MDTLQSQLSTRTRRQTNTDGNHDVSGRTDLKLTFVTTEEGSLKEGDGNCNYHRRWYKGVRNSL